MKINSKLIELAKYFSKEKPLYIVGGYVRNEIIGLEETDIDITSAESPENVEKFLENSDFFVGEKALRLGTLTIKSKDFYGEFTTFRKDNYPEDGSHLPINVEFNVSIEEDARRRDFTCNSIYLNPLTNELVDIVGGAKDIENKIIRAVDDPHKVFSADGLRILRMVRFACELGFDIDPETFKAAKENVNKIKDISAERIKDELNKIFISDTRYRSLNTKDAHLRGINLLDELGILEILLPELTCMKGLAQPKKHHLYDAYRHSLEAYKFSDPKIRWAALLHDIGKPLSIAAQGDMHNHGNLGRDAAKKIFERLKFSNEFIRHNCKLIENHMIDLDGVSTSVHKLRRFLVKNQDIAEDLALLKAADFYGTKGYEIPDNRIDRLYKELLVDGTPLSVKDLPVHGKDLIELDIEPTKRGKLLDKLWIDAVDNPNLMNRDVALNYIKKMEKQIK